MPVPKFVQAKKTTLKTSVTAAETAEIVLKNLVDIYGTALAMTDFEGTIYLTIEPGSDNEEIISATSFTVNSDGSVSLDTGITRGLTAKSPYGSAGTARAHAAGVIVVVSNNPQLYDAMMDFVVNLEDAQTVAGVKTFSSVPKTSAGNPTADEDLARKAYVDSVITSGAITTDSLIIAGTAGETIAAGDLVYFDTTTANEWMLCDADTAATVDNSSLGIAQGAGTDGNPITGGVLIHGLDNNQSGMTQGDPMYASDTAGEIASSAGTVEVVIGLAYDADTLYFNPRYAQQITENQQDALAGTSGTPSASNKYVTNDDTTGTGDIVRDSLIHFGGDGSDGALAITTGTTTIDCSNEKVVVKNYTSISITGDGDLAFSNPNTNGTIVILRSQGGVTLTSSAAPMIDMSGMGAAGGAAASGINPGSDGSDGFVTVEPATVINGGDGGGDGADDTGDSGPGGTGAGSLDVDDANTMSLWAGGPMLVTGAGGAGGGSSEGANGTGGAGARGGGGLYIECAGAWNFTTASGISVGGDAGSNGATDGSYSNGGGGGGAGGSLVVLYNSLTANSGTVTVAGGAGGRGGNGSDGTGGAGGAGGNGSSGSGNGGAGGVGQTPATYTGGGGGGGGANFLGTTNGSDGSAGTGSTGNGGAGGGGGGGASGYSYIAVNPRFS